jgi:hypothetical protein
LLGFDFVVAIGLLWLHRRYLATFIRRTIIITAIRLRLHARFSA